MTLRVEQLGQQITDGEIDPVGFAMMDMRGRLAEKRLGAKYFWPDVRSKE